MDTTNSGNFPPDKGNADSGNDIVDPHGLLKRW